MLKIRNPFQQRKRVLHAGIYLNWLGMNIPDVSHALRSLGIGSKSFAASPLNLLSPKDNEPCSSDNQLRTIAHYVACIASEQNLTDLTEIPSIFAALVDKWLPTLRAEYRRITNLFDDFDPNAIVIVQGYEPTNAIARLVALERELPMIALENTSLIDRMLWDDQSAITTNRNLAANFFWRYDAITDNNTSNAYVDGIIRETKSRKQAEHTSPDTPYLSKTAQSKRTILFLAQVYTDSSNLFGSNEWGDQIELITNLSQLALSLNLRLLIKLHPKEIAGAAPVTGAPYAKLTYRKLSESAAFQASISSGVDVVVDSDNQFDTYSLLSCADVAVTMNSQAGLEAIIRSVPVVLGGHAFYGGLGFTFDAPSPRLLQTQVEAALDITNEQLLQQTHLARKFTYIYFNKYCVPKTPEALAKLVARRCL